MDRSELPLVPEWLKNSGSVAGGVGTDLQFSSSSLHSDDHHISKHTRNRSSLSDGDHEIGHLFASDQATSINFRRSYSSNSSPHSLSYSSFGRGHCYRDWENIDDYPEKCKLVLGNHRWRDYSDPLGSILPNRSQKDILQHSQSIITRKCGDTWPRKVAGDSNYAKSKHSNGDGLFGGSSVVSSTIKSAFEREFPSLLAEERQGGSEIGRVSSSGLNTAIQSLPIGNLSVIGCDGWKSALVEMPAIAGSNSTGTALGQQTISACSASVSPTTGTGLNMAETLAQGHPPTRALPQLSIGNQRLEELTMKQSRQLIPLIPSMPKALVPSPSEKSKPYIGQQHTFPSSHPINQIPHGVSAKSDVTKISVGNLCILNSSRELNGFSFSSTAKNGPSPANRSRVANSLLGLTPSAAGSSLSKNLSNNLSPASAERRPIASRTTLERKSSSQAQSRNDFFKSLSRKNSSVNPSSAVPDPGQVVSVAEISDKLATVALRDMSVPFQSRDALSLDTSVADLSERRGEIAHSGNACDASQRCLRDSEEHSSPGLILHPDEEAAFLRSLGWEENAGEDEGLTEEEISAFYMKISCAVCEIAAIIKTSAWDAGKRYQWHLTRTRKVGAVLCLNGTCLLLIKNFDLANVWEKLGNLSMTAEWMSGAADVC
ncbi:hypothetical protein F2P56_036619 [Juglans regia]|uniref:Uncharacterized protein LOC109013412 isoform X2 n=2 Tax=Juglans regia TaxID=51240 RepID=A0A2I4H4H2_JUGRE|nr:uncharacterized protein LOC109013412 isoform X2 [Juglans regia]KAF5444117.1 hypothetical protein F2P56_036619 [Juglans regia]